MSEIKISDEMTFVNFPQKEIKEELDSLVGGELQKYKSCEEKRERLLEKLRVNKSQISKLLRAYVKAGKKFGMDSVFNGILKLLSPDPRGLTFILYFEIIENLIGDMEEEDIQDFVNQIIKICSSAPETYDEKNKAGISHDLAELVYIMDKDIHGELGSEETALLKKNMTKWQEQIKMMREKLKSMS